MLTLMNTQTDTNTISVDTNTPVNVNVDVTNSDTATGSTTSDLLNTLSVLAPQVESTFNLAPFQTLIEATRNYLHNEFKLQFTFSLLGIIGLLVLAEGPK